MQFPPNGPIEVELDDPDGNSINYELDSEEVEEVKKYMRENSSGARGEAEKMELFIEAIGEVKGAYPSFLLDGAYEQPTRKEKMLYLLQENAVELLILYAVTLTIHAGMGNAGLQAIGMALASVFFAKIILFGFRKAVRKYQMRKVNEMLEEGN